MEYLLDTDWIIHALAGEQKTLATLERLTFARIAVSYASVGEVYEGAFTFSNPQAHLHTFRQLLRPFQVLALTDPIMEGLQKSVLLCVVEGNSSQPLICLAALLPLRMI